jgi:hypothetical protein
MANLANQSVYLGSHRRGNWMRKLHKAEIAAEAAAVESEALVLFTR